VLKALVTSRTTLAQYFLVSRAEAMAFVTRCDQCVVACVERRPNWKSGILLMAKVVRRLVRSFSNVLPNLEHVIDL